MIRRGEPKAADDIGYDEWRTCPFCNAKFRPSVVLSGISTEYFCSERCAWDAYRAREVL